MQFLPVFSSERRFSLGRIVDQRQRPPGKQMRDTSLTAARLTGRSPLDTDLRARRGGWV